MVCSIYRGVTIGERVCLAAKLESPSSYQTNDTYALVSNTSTALYSRRLNTKQFAKSFVLRLDTETHYLLIACHSINRVRRPFYIDSRRFPFEIKWTPFEPAYLKRTLFLLTVSSILLNISCTDNQVGISQWFNQHWNQCSAKFDVTQ